MRTDQYSFGLESTVSEAAKEIVLDIKNYIALGCLVLETGSASHNGASHERLLQAINDLSKHGWIRTEALDLIPKPQILLRIYVLPNDVGRRYIDRSNAKLDAALSLLVRSVDVNPKTWQGIPNGEQHSFDSYATALDQSLFYMFNNVPSPSPQQNLFHRTNDKYIREAMEDLLDTKWSIGLKSTLYPYQRRSAAQMLQHEEQPRRLLDPRLEERRAPDGQTFYYNSREGMFLRTPLFYDSCRGGILAETMGLGKTLISLALILSTRHHLPKIPEEYSARVSREQTASLQDMAVAAIQRSSIPWQVELARIEHHTATSNSRIREKLESQSPSYDIPLFPTRWNRNTILPPPRRLMLAATTIIVVPRNLCNQWYSEISKHIEADSLKVLVMEDLSAALPHPEILRTYDVVLFSRNRFDIETRDGSDEQGRRPPPAHIPLICRCPYIGSTRERDCHCLKLDDVYDSPLKHLHFKRLIVDEGHYFSANKSKAVAVATKLITADNRWIISGTFAKDLLGVELDLDGFNDSVDKEEVERNRALLLEQRRRFDPQEDQSGAAKSIGALAANYLQMKPWFGDSSLHWDDHIYRHEDSRKRTYTCYTNVLQRTLNALVVKTQPQDVEKKLPPLNHQVVYLEPSFYDKLTANLFTLVLTANAVTSERTDQDYLFHKNSSKPRQQLISNLRQSAFFWTGFSEDDINATLKNGYGYLNKETAVCSPEDRKLLTELLQHAELILLSQGWKSLSKSHELGLYVNDWIDDSVEHWAFDTHLQPILTGVSQLLEVQKHVNIRCGETDPGEGLSGMGIRSLSAAMKGEDDNKTQSTLLGVPASSLDGEPNLKRRASVANKAKTSPTKVKIEVSSDGVSPTKTKRRRLSISDTTELPEDSSYRRAQIIGSTSTKMSYLISQIMKYYKDEKILIFYEGDNIAYYIAQMLELLHIKHEIYAKSLKASLKSEYVVRFDQEEQDRVLLMDVIQAAHGLNVTSASRIYFVNPVCRPSIEAQAIKRAHRIGQTKSVYVETLILRGTIEEKMHERAKRMTISEHHDARALEDDGGIREIIQRARLISLTDDEMKVEGQIAPFEQSQQLWGRKGWREVIATEPRKKARTNAAKSEAAVAVSD